MLRRSVSSASSETAYRGNGISRDRETELLHRRPSATLPASQYRACRATKLSCLAALMRRLAATRAGKAYIAPDSEP
jgi:hypothetical protein